MESCSQYIIEWKNVVTRPYVWLQFFFKKVSVSMSVCLENTLPLRTSWRYEWWSPLGWRNETVFIFFILFICISSEHVFLLLSTPNVIFKNFVSIPRFKKAGRHLSGPSSTVGIHTSGDGCGYQALGNCHGGLIALPCVLRMGRI